MSCQNFVLEGACVAACPALYYADAGRVCRPCHRECMSSCAGPNATDCFACRNVFYALEGCLAGCPVGTVADASRTCRSCSSQCDSLGCTGQASTQCLRCRTFTSMVVTPNDCLAVCPARSYAGSALVNGIPGSPACLPCHAQCSSACSVSDCLFYFYVLDA